MRRHPQKRATRFGALNQAARIKDSSRENCDRTASQAHLYVTALYRAAGTKGTSHSGRRTFATRALANGATIEQVQLLLGHDDIDQTSRYIDVSEEAISRAVATVW
ncbi:tyrosine-type recombinase/integrase [Burkholderia sp. S171]|uniref:tyrosine-type recombinase/integrase n=1 Tax=Burkholderia sp. S171 TaxID=1641860 RepID=UPI00131B1D77|nr:tyrosine-type recombinase/integrase [Burkholderia sp. S171]